MNRPEATPDLLLETYLEQFEKVGAWTDAIRLKWVMHRETTVQTDDDETVLLATRVKNKTL